MKNSSVCVCCAYSNLSIHSLKICRVCVCARFFLLVCRCYWSQSFFVRRFIIIDPLSVNREENEGKSVTVCVMCMHDRETEARKKGKSIGLLFFRFRFSKKDQLDMESWKLRRKCQDFGHRKTAPPRPPRCLWPVSMSLPSIWTLLKSCMPFMSWWLRFFSPLLQHIVTISDLTLLQIWYVRHIFCAIIRSTNSH